VAEYRDKQWGRYHFRACDPSLQRWLVFRLSAGLSRRRHRYAVSLVEMGVWVAWRATRLTSFSLLPRLAVNYHRRRRLGRSMQPQWWLLYVRIVRQPSRRCLRLAAFHRQRGCLRRALQRLQRRREVVSPREQRGWFQSVLGWKYWQCTQALERLRRHAANKQQQRLLWCEAEALERRELSALACRYLQTCRALQQQKRGQERELLLAKKVVVKWRLVAAP